MSPVHELDADQSILGAEDLGIELERRLGILQALDGDLVAVVLGGVSIVAAYFALFTVIRRIVKKNTQGK